MRRALIAVLALMLAASMQGASRAQDVRLHRAGEMRGIDGRVLGALRSLPAEKDAQEILRLVLSAGGFAGMEDRIILRASQDVANAIATIERNERYIIYNSKFMQDIVNRTQNYWSRVAILAHEVGHHVQNLLGISGKVAQAAARGAPEQANGLSVRQELQADCFAGIWANHANRSRQVLEAGDIEEGLNAASAIGDDRLQKQSSGRVNPESFTHGTSAQRVRWFRKGYESGDLGDGDTFRARAL